MLAVVDEDEKLKYTMYTSGQNREMWFLTEDGLYEVLMQSRKPIAKEFKREVKQILKTIRQTGSYTIQETNYPNSQRLGEVVEFAKLIVRFMKDNKDKPSKIKSVIAQQLLQFDIVVPEEFYTLDNILSEVLPHWDGSIIMFLDSFGDVADIPSNEVYNAYLTYCNGMNHKPISHVGFSRQVNRIAGTYTKTARINREHTKIFAR